MLLLINFIFNVIGALAWDPDLRIVGGYPVSIDKRPFQVVLYQIVRGEAIPDCGGAIINRRWVLTAAHCVHGIPREYFLIGAGTDDLADESSILWYDVAQILPHERFHPSSAQAENDIALIMTKRKFEYSWRVKPIRIARSSPRPDSEAFISGFGVTQEGSTIMSRILREVSVTVLRRDHCENLLLDIADDLGMSNTHFCAAYLQGGRDACQGDSGGPVTIGENLVGLVSWGVGCAEEMVPAFYTDVSQFRRWINDNVKRYSGRSRKALPTECEMK